MVGHISIHDYNEVPSGMLDAMNISCACIVKSDEDQFTKLSCDLIFIPSPSLAARGRSTIFSAP